MKDMLQKFGKEPDENDDKANAKMQVLHELRNMAMGMMGDKVKDKLPGHEMHGVEVMAHDPEGLHKGLQMADHVIPHSLNADRDEGFGEKLDSKLPNQSSNGSDMDAAAEDVEERTEHGRSEPAGDQGEPDQQMLNPHRSMTTEDDYDDLDHDELSKLIDHLRSKQAKKSKY